MEKALWYLFTATRGGANRVRVVRSLAERPKNASQLAKDLGVAYSTARHHLDMLADHGVVERGGNDYATLFFLTERFEQHGEEFERIAKHVEIDTQ